MVTFSIIMPVYNVERYVATAIESVLKQTFTDFELIIVIDESPDNSSAICVGFNDPRIRIVHQQNLGLAGARNTGIHHAQGQFIAFLDADDLWAPEKLESHLKHLQNNSHVGVSYCPSLFIDEYGNNMGIKQTPKLKNITIEDIFCRNPVGNGSSPVIRKAVFDQIAYCGKSRGVIRDWYFDETFRQSEDIECWLRIASQTNWQFEGIKPALTFYRINEGGLSANVVNQFDSWKRASRKIQVKAPDCFRKWGKLAEAYQLRYLARRAIRSRNPELASKLTILALKTDYRILMKEPARTLNTLICSMLLSLLPLGIFSRLEKIAMSSVGFINQALSALSPSS